MYARLFRMYPVVETVRVEKTIIYVKVRGEKERALECLSDVQKFEAYLDTTLDEKSIMEFNS